SDTFHKDIPDNEIEEMFNIMKVYSQHTYIVLTKRIERAVKFFETRQVPDNVWIGTSIESEKYSWRADELIKIKAKVHFISYEPLIGYVISGISRDIEWVIVGGESGSHAREMKEVYVDNIFNECQAKGIAFFFKQWGKGLSKCKCHNAFGCRLYRGSTWDELPLPKVITNA
ncbi:MAG: DUF5131 family protein, partial [Thaumarchaeota archaeon]|nr:DUF5131 family protein [Nitrososphaerota archaeon]